MEQNLIVSTDASQYTITQHVVQDASSSSSPPSPIFSAIFKFVYQTSTPTIESSAIVEHLLAPTSFNNDFSLQTLLTMEEAYTDMMAQVQDGTAKSSDWFDWDFASPDWSSSSQCSPDQSVFSSPAQLMPSDEDVLLLSPSSSFEIDIADYVSNHKISFL